MIPAAVVSKLIRLGLTDDQMDAVVALLEECADATEARAGAAIAARRAGDRERKQRQRAADEARSVTGRHGTSQDISDKRDTSPPPAPSPEPPTPPAPTPAALRSRPRSHTREELDLIETKLLTAAGVLGNPPPGLLNLAPMLGLLDRGLSLDEDLVPTIRSKNGQRFSSWNYLVTACLESHSSRLAAESAAIIPLNANRVRAGPGQANLLPRDPVLQAREEILRERAAQHDL